uniref:Uncharacterized protein n=1 Tax=Anopheles maculatus TaxID=74869 RepID=A0A182SRE9_9DIPT
METIKSLLLQTSPGAGPTIGTDPDYAVPHRKAMQDPFGSPARVGLGPMLSPIMPTVTNLGESADDVPSQTVIDDDSARVALVETHKAELSMVRTAGGTADFIHPKLSKLKQPPVIVGVAVKRSLRKSPEVIMTKSSSSMSVASVTKATTQKSSTFEQWHKDIFEIPSTTLPVPLQYDDLIVEKPEQMFVRHSVDGANSKTNSDIKFLEISHRAQSDSVQGNAEDNGQKGNDNDLIDLIDFSSDQEEATDEPNVGDVQKTFAKENEPPEAAILEHKNGPITGTGRVKKVTFLLDDDPYRSNDSDNDSDIVKDPHGERGDLPDSEASEEETVDRDDGEVLAIDIKSFGEPRVSVDESDPTINGRKVTPKHRPPCLLRNEISTETRQTDDNVFRASHDAYGRGRSDVAGKASTAESSHVDSEADGRWSPQRLLEQTDGGGASGSGQLETEMVQRACSSPLHGESESHRHRQRHQRHEDREENATVAICPAAVSANSDGGAVTRRIDETLACTFRPPGAPGRATVGQRADVCQPNACAGTESINGERRRKHQHHGSSVKHDPHDVGPSVKGRPQASRVVLDDG